jgi:hypothetical protein
MQYQVTFQLAGEERTEAVDAPDAATAVSKIQFDFGRTDEMFELISVQVDEPVTEDDDAASVPGADRSS